MKKLNDFIEKVGMDKVAHFFGIALVALIVSLVFTKANPGEPAATYAACGFIGGVIVAIAKEAVDFFSGNQFETFSLSDIAAGATGAFVASLVALLFF